MSHKEPLYGRKFIQMMRPILGLPENVVHITISASAGGMVDIDLSMMPNDTKPEAEKPQVDWSQAPEWANYWAMCSYGGTMWFETEPRQSKSFWYQPIGDLLPAPNFGWSKDRWKESLVKRPS